MSGRPEVTSTAAEPVSSRSRRGNSWAEVAAVFGFFGVIFFLSWGYWCKLPRGEVIAFGLTGGPLIILSLLVALLNSLPCTRYPGDYPTLVPFRHGSRWLVHPPGVTFWAVFPSSLCVLYYLGLGIVAATLDWGLRWR